MSTKMFAKATLSYMRRNSDKDPLTDEYCFYIKKHYSETLHHFSQLYMWGMVNWDVEDFIFTLNWLCHEAAVQRDSDIFRKSVGYLYTPKGLHWFVESKFRRSRK